MGRRVYRSCECTRANEDLPPPGDRRRNLDQSQRLPRFFEEHRSQEILSFLLKNVILPFGAEGINRKHRAFDHLSGMGCARRDGERLACGNVVSLAANG